MDRTLDELIQEIKRMSKYRHLDLCEATIRDILSIELPLYKNKREAIKAARRKLHRVVGLYLGDPDYVDQASALARAAVSRNDAEIRDACASIMSRHVSTAERLPHLKEFYATIFGLIRHPSSILDLACGLHPLALPWMELRDLASFEAYDCNGARVEFLNSAFRQLQWPATAFCQDIVVAPPPSRAHVAFLLKEPHRLEDRRRGSCLQIIDNLRVDWLVASVPRRNMRADAGAEGKYKPILVSIFSQRQLSYKEFAFPDELVFCVYLGRLSRP